MLKGIISSWSRSVEAPASKAPNFLAYKLDHEYTDASLKFQSLKGLDKVKAEYLRKVCAGANACFYLASMERKVVGSCEEDYSGYSRWERHRTQEMHTFEEIVEQSTELKRMIDLDGAVLAREISIDDADIVQEDPFGRDPDKEDFEGYTGNEGASATHFYHDTVRIALAGSERYYSTSALNIHRSQFSYRSARLHDSSRSTFNKVSSTRIRGIGGFSRRCKRIPTMKLGDKSCTILLSCFTKRLLDLRPLNRYKHREGVIDLGKITFPLRKLNGPWKLASCLKIKPCSRWP